jgi:hypothetical protein
MPLTDIRIRNAKPGEKPFKLSDANGLYLEVRPSGTKLWRYRYYIDGKEGLFALGEYPEIGLAQARNLRDEARKLVKQGIHPAHQRKIERIKKAQEEAELRQQQERALEEARGRIPTSEGVLNKRLGEITAGEALAGLSWIAEEIITKFFERSSAQAQAPEKEEVRR